MTLVNTLRYSLLLMAAFCASLAAYVYHNVDSVMQSVIRLSLRDYGITDVRTLNTRWAHNRFTLESLWLEGESNNTQYQLSFIDVALTYQWRELLGQPLKTLRIKSIDAAITDGEAEPSSIASAPLDLATFYPPTIVSALPLTVIDIDTWRLNYQKNGFPIASCTGSAHFNEGLQLNLQAALSGGNITGLITTDTKENTRVDMKITGETGEIAALHADLDRRNTLWHWTVEGDWQQDALVRWLKTLYTDFDLPPLPITAAKPGPGRGGFFGYIEHPETLQRAIDSSKSPAVGIDASLKLWANIEGLAYAKILREISGELNGSVTVQREQMNLDLTLTNTLATPIEGNYSLAITSMHLDSELNTRAQLTLQSDVQGELEIRQHAHASPPLSFSFEQSGSQNNAAYKMDATLAETALTLAISGVINPETGQGRHLLEIRSDDLSRLHSKVRPTLSNWLPEMSLPDIKGGELQLNTTLQTNDYSFSGWSQISQLSIENFSATYADYGIKQASLTMQWSGLNEWRSLQPMQLTIGELDAGFPVNDVTMTAALQESNPVLAPQVNIAAFSANLFDGMIYLDSPATLRPAAHTNEFTFRVEDWELARLVAIQQNPDIKATGTLQGKLPVAITDGRLLITEGYLNAKPPGGTIRYNSDGMAGNFDINTELELALELLSDFHYEVLNSEVGLDPQGNLLLALSLGGHNPERFDAQEVRFNITVEQNLDPLLQSLRVSDTLTRNIEQRLH